MPLKLTITSFQRLSPGQESIKILDRGSLTIGRATQNGWVLQDPERILSSNHCVVHYEDSDYFLTDTSTNGTFLNDSEQRIPRNQTVPLAEGDHFVLGEYEIEVNLTSDGEEAPAIEQGAVTDIVPMSHDRASPADPSLLSLRRPVEPSIKGAAATEPPPEQLMPERASFEPPEIQSQARFAHPIEPPPAAVDPLEPAAESAVPTPPPEADGGEPPAAAFPAVGSDPLVDGGEPSAAASPAVGSDLLIPEDWWLAPSSSPGAPPPIAPPPPVTPTPPAMPPPVEPPPVEPPLAAPVKPSAPAVAKSPAASIEPAIVKAPAPPAAGPASAAEAEALFAAFLKGAGLPQAALAGSEHLRIMGDLGAIFRETVRGLMDVLVARGDVKGEFRLDRTTIGPVENNPLKTPPGQPPLAMEEAMGLLLMRRQEAYMSPVQAVREGFDDIKAHQLAVMAGIQAALNRLLERFDPANLETRLQQTVLDSILPASRKAKYWDLFTAEYQAIAREAEDDFNELFGDEFARAYREWLDARP